MTATITNPKIDAVRTRALATEAALDEAKRELATGANVKTRERFSGLRSQLELDRAELDALEQAARDKATADAAAARAADEAELQELVECAANASAAYAPFLDRVSAALRDLVEALRVKAPVDAAMAKKSARAMMLTQRLGLPHHSAPRVPHDLGARLSAAMVRETIAPFEAELESLTTGVSAEQLRSDGVRGVLGRRFDIVEAVRALLGGQ